MPCDQPVDFCKIKPAHCYRRLLIEGLRRLLILLPGREVDHGSMEAWWRAYSCHGRLRLSRTWSHMILHPALTPRAGLDAGVIVQGLRLRTTREESGRSGIYSFPSPPLAHPPSAIPVKWRNHRRSVGESCCRCYTSMLNAGVP